MSFELLLLVVITAGLAARALWASAVLNRHIGWLVAVSWTGGLISGLGLESDWIAIPCLLVFVVSEFLYQTGGDGARNPPARWLEPLRRARLAGPPGRHGRHGGPGRHAQEAGTPRDPVSPTVDEARQSSVVRDTPGPSPGDGS